MDTVDRPSVCLCQMDFEKRRRAPGRPDSGGLAIYQPARLGRRIISRVGPSHTLTNTPSGHTHLHARAPIFHGSSGRTISRTISKVFGTVKLIRRYSDILTEPSIRRISVEPLILIFVAISIMIVKDRIHLINKAISPPSLKVTLSNRYF